MSFGEDEGGVREEGALVHGRGGLREGAMGRGREAGRRRETEGRQAAGEGGEGRECNSRSSHT